MEVTRIYTGEDGLSHFASCSLPLAANTDEGGELNSYSPGSAAVTFRSREPVNEFHTAPRPGFMIITGGVLHVECSDGTGRRFEPGDVLLPHDTTGVGHSGRSEFGPVLSLFIPINEEALSKLILADASGAASE